MAEQGEDRRVRPETILLATDLDDLERLMPFALRMAGETGARLLLLHVLSFAAEYAVDAAGMPYYDPESVFLSVNDTLESWCRRARKQGVGCEGIVRGGHSPAREILAAVRQFKADRIILGTRSRSKIGKLLLGSVAEQVLRSIDLPVFTVGPEAHLATPGNDRKPAVLFATTLGEGHRARAALACQIAVHGKERLLLLHVLPPLDEIEGRLSPSSLDSAVLHELADLAHDTGANCALDIQSKVAHGEPATEILAEACACDADLIVLGVAQHGVVDSIFHDHTIDRVLAHSHCPVLTMPPSSS